MERRPDRLPVIVLAGGRSRRFGRDKLAVRLGGRAALARVVARVRPLASEVIVSTSSESRKQKLSRLLPSTVRFVLDRPEPGGGGPAAAMARGLEEVASGPVLFVPGDMPWVETRALRRFVTVAQSSPADVAAPVWQSSGETEHLVQWHRGLDAARHLPSLRPDPRSGRRASEYLRAVPRTLLIPVGMLSYRPESFSHLTYPADVRHPALRGDVGRASHPRLVQGIPKRRYREAQAERAAGRPEAAARAFAAESRWYVRAGLSFLAQHAYEDAARALEDGSTTRSAGVRRRGKPSPLRKDRGTVNRATRHRAAR